jgi:hypothetical protein
MSNPVNNAFRSGEFNVWKCIRELPDERIIAELPPSMARLVGKIPVSLILDLIEFFGGLRIGIPSEASEKNEMVRVLGMEKVIRLCETCKGELLVIPTGRYLKHVAKAYKAHQLRGHGWSVRNMARYMEVTERSVNYLLAAERQAA